MLRHHLEYSIDIAIVHSRCSLPHPHASVEHTIKPRRIWRRKQSFSVAHRECVSRRNFSDVH